MGLKLTVAAEKERNLTFANEQALLSESLFVSELIHNELNDELRIRSQIGQEYKMLNNLNCYVCIVELTSLPKDNPLHTQSSSWVTQFTSIARTAFEQHAFRPFITSVQSSLVIMAFNLLPNKTKKDTVLSKERLHQAYKQMDKIINKENRKIRKLSMGIGEMHKGFRNAHIGFEQAKKALLLKSFYQSAVISYDELGAFQILLSLHEKGLLESFVFSHLGPLIEVDQKKNSDLLKTLKIYLESNGSKQSVADELHIVRQSLYYRLEKIKELLGEDFMSTQKRLALQLAIQAYELLNFEGTKDYMSI